MIIRLPERFIYSNKKHENATYVENGILYINLPKVHEDKKEDIKKLKID